MFFPATVDLSNLHRQILHTEARIGMSKAESAKIAVEGDSFHFFYPQFSHSLVKLNFTVTSYLLFLLNVINSKNILKVTLTVYSVDWSQNYFLKTKM